IGQTQVNNKVELDFARGLRAILRQDPDIVMVGEIRDVETAEIAVQASLTGHLVLSTLHTNTAVGSVTRLRDMGIEPFLLSSSLVALVAQRLVRVLCDHCKRQYTPTEPELKTLKVTASEATNVCAPHGCEKCSHTGFTGRTGVYEVVNVDDEMRSMIHDGESEHRLEAYARTQSPGILDDGIRLVLSGTSSLEEVLYAVRES
ncbi:MAG: Flp pilus assembly complex ATPase component TadA, partial [Gammaproteobacteria bacterium]|nr:Flp pilus assembly complex ATPase component TadA [Gammaproteobacteria bacterium]